MTLEVLCSHIRNFFDYERQFGSFTIADGAMEVTDAVEGQYIRIVGSMFNDGVYQYPFSGLTDETFDGAVWLLKIPQEVLSLLSDINAWEEKFGADMSLLGPFTSESFGGYSYTKKSGGSDGASEYSWQDAFRSRLNVWRKI